MKLSAVVVVKNEEKIIADCLDSLSFCDEIVVIDDGSEDRTREIAERITNKVFDNDKGSEGFVEAVRKFAIGKATGDWVLIVDADERITPELAKEIKETLSGDPKYDAYRIVRSNYYLGNNPWPQSDKIERLFRRDSVKDWEWRLHTSPEVKGGVGELKNTMIHLTHTDLTSMLNKTIKWSEEEARMRFDSKHPKMSWWRFPRVMLSAFFSYYLKQKGWKVGTAGLVESLYQAYSAFITYAKLWELQRKK
jgi:glycosyltransferase involved in cell wall biosynthesis